MFAGCALLGAARPLAAQIHVLVPEDPNRERRAYTATVMREFTGVMNEWRAGWNSDDARAVSGLYTEDGTLLLAAADTAARGRDQIRSTLAAALSCSGEIRTGVEDFRVNGEMAYALGRYTVSAPEGAEAAGTYVVVLENRGRKWLIRSQMFRPDEAAPPPAGCGGQPPVGEGETQP